MKYPIEHAFFCSSNLHFDFKYILYLISMQGRLQSIKKGFNPILHQANKICLLLNNFPLILSPSFERYAMVLQI